jgi:SAM-dependent methyltransferase
MIIDPNQPPENPEARIETGLSASYPLGQDMLKLERLLRKEVVPHLKKKAEARILDLACGRCDEADTLMGAIKEGMDAEKVKLIGADIRIREIRQARERMAGKDAEFLIEDATKLSAHKQMGDDFDLVFLRHQNFWHGSEVWKKIFDQGLARVSDDGLLVITSYFDKEHQLALEALQGLGAELVLSKRNEASRALDDAPGKLKSVDRWIAVLKKPK